MSANRRLGCIAAVDALALVAVRPDIDALRRDLAAPGSRITSVGADRVVAQLAGAGLWLVAAWVAVGLLAIVGAQLPGACGRMSRRVVRLVVPRVVASLLAGSAGLGVLLAPVAATAVPSPVWPSVPTQPSSSTHLPAPVWPRTGQAPAPVWPRTGQAPAPAPAPSAHGHGASEQVQPGDSLWLLAARRLGADATPLRIAGYWPQIYAANRTVIGDNPSLITPGQLLTEPAPSTPEPTT